MPLLSLCRARSGSCCQLSDAVIGWQIHAGMPSDCSARYAAPAPPRANSPNTLGPLPLMRTPHAPAAVSAACSPAAVLCRGRMTDAGQIAMRQRGQQCILLLRAWLTEFRRKTAVSGVQCAVGFRGGHAFPGAGNQNIAVWQGWAGVQDIAHALGDAGAAPDAEGNIRPQLSAQHFQ